MNNKNRGGWAVHSLAPVLVALVLGMGGHALIVGAKVLDLQAHQFEKDAHEVEKGRQVAAKSANAGETERACDPAADRQCAELRESSHRCQQTGAWLELVGTVALLMLMLGECLGRQRHENNQTSAD